MILVLMLALITPLTISEHSYHKHYDYPVLISHGRTIYRLLMRHGHGELRGRGSLPLYPINDTVARQYNTGTTRRWSNLEGCSHAMAAMQGSSPARRIC
jgi:hypothetical protein